ncbi:MAG: RNA methyltransferase [Patescibacteria group bacterium]|nr:RNA methyltransferase [Patescibacteria group bacterium]
MNKKNIIKKEIVEISSLNNPKIKNIAKLIKNGSERQAFKIIIVDGLREISEALKAGWEIKEFFYCLDLIKNNNKNEVKKIIPFSEDVYELSKKAFEKISYKKNPDGCLAVFSYQENNLKNIELKKDPIILILESVEKPGNLGGIIRTAYAGGVDLIILNDQKTDLYSPNVIRSSTGFIFSMPIVLASISETIKYLDNKKIDIFATSISAKDNHFQVDFKKGGAIVFGTEAFGLSDKWLKAKVRKIRIPMIAGVDSLNVSVSVGIIVYEAIRQKKILK